MTCVKIKRGVQRWFKQKKRVKSSESFGEENQNKKNNLLSFKKKQQQQIIFDFIIDSIATNIVTFGERKLV